MSTGISLVWTTLPNGFDPSTGMYKATVLVTPRLLTGGVTMHLADFPLFVDWPSVVKGLTWSMQIDLATNVMAHVVRTPDAIGSDGSSIWQAIFPKDKTTVTDGAAPAQSTAMRINSYDAASLGEAIKAAYKHAAVHHTVTAPILDAARRDPINDLVREVRAGVEAAPHLARALHTTADGSSHHAMHAEYKRRGGDPTGLGYEFARHAVFYDHGSHRRMIEQSVMAPTDLAPPPAPTLPVPDFHQIMGQLGDHPAMLRKLGLVIDLEFTLPAGYSVPASPASAVHPIKAVPTSATLTAAGAKGGSPWSQVAIGSTSLRPQPRDASTMVDGMLPMKSGPYLVQGLDTDGAISQFVNNTPQTGAPQQGALPALRSAGLAVLRTDRETQVAAALQRQATTQNSWLQDHNNADAMSFAAEDMVRGYRVDVRTTVGATTGPYKPLCSRTSTIAVGGTTLMTTSDEGYVKGTAATSTKAGEVDLHQALFGWEGWSLVASRPGRSITSSVDPSTQVQSESGVSKPNDPAPTLPSPIAIAVKPGQGSLPTLRFGNKYEFRARLTDLAGNDMALASDVGTSAPVKYLRWEPVVAPVLVPQRSFTEGESLERLVIRSDPYGSGQHAATYAPTLASGAAAHPMRPYDATCARWIAPPKTSWALAESHKAFDGYFNAMATQAAAKDMASFNATKITLYKLSMKESGTFLDKQYLDTSTAQPRAINRLIVTNAGSSSTRDVRKGDPLNPGEYVVIPATEAVILPYIPDANAHGAAFAFPGTTSLGVQTRTWGARSGCAWPELAVPQIVLQEGTAIAVSGMDASGGAGGSPITVSLPPGAQIDVTYSSTLADPTVMENATTSPTLPDVGQNALLTPSRKLTLVHATQRPPMPSPGITAQPRAQGQTGAAITGTVGADGLTADHVELFANWTETLDSELGPGITEGTDGYRHAAHTSRVQTWALKTTDTGVPLGYGALTHQFGDTKHREVTYYAVATSRFREYFPADLTADPANLTATSYAIHQSIPSSARPPMPKVLYTVPTFKQLPATTGTATNGSPQTSKVRSGGGLRVYVDRPWFCSGDGEMLAVLLHSPTPATDPASILDMVSVWGMDPAFYPQSETIQQPLDATHFVQDPNNPHYDLGEMNLAEGTGNVRVLGYKPKFNKDRDVWYFDIELSMDALDAPFVRLVLARVQPTSIRVNGASLNLSPAVRADVIKLANDRTAVYATNLDGSVDVTVSGRAFSNESWTPPAAPVPPEPCDPIETLGHCPKPKPIPKPPAPKYAGFAVNSAAGSGHVVTAQFEQTTVANPGDLDWAPLDSPLILDDCQTGSQYDNYSTLLSFKGHLATLAALPAGGKRRVVVREWEVYEADDGAADANGFTVHFASGESIKSRARVVYTDVFPL